MSKRSQEGARLKLIAEKNRLWLGNPCQCPAMKNGRCRLHGGKSSGAPKGNRNAWKQRRAMRILVRSIKELMK